MSSSAAAPGVVGASASAANLLTMNSTQEPPAPAPTTMDEVLDLDFASLVLWAIRILCPAVAFWYFYYQKDRQLSEGAASMMNKTSSRGEGRKGGAASGVHSSTAQDTGESSPKATSSEKTKNSSSTSASSSKTAKAAGEKNGNKTSARTSVGHTTSGGMDSKTDTDSTSKNEDKTKPGDQNKVVTSATTMDDLREMKVKTLKDTPLSPAMAKKMQQYNKAKTSSMLGKYNNVANNNGAAAGGGATTTNTTSSSVLDLVDFDEEGTSSALQDKACDLKESSHGTMTKQDSSKNGTVVPMQQPAKQATTCSNSPQCSADGGDAKNGEKGEDAGGSPNEKAKDGSKSNANTTSTTTTMTHSTGAVKGGTPSSTAADGSFSYSSSEGTSSPAASDANTSAHSLDAEAANQEAQEKLSKISKANLSGIEKIYQDLVKHKHDISSDTYKMLVEIALDAAKWYDQQSVVEPAFWKTPKKRGYGESPSTRVPSYQSTPLHSNKHGPSSPEKNTINDLLALVGGPKKDENSNYPPAIYHAGATEGDHFNMAYDAAYWAGYYNDPSYWAGYYSPHHFPTAPAHHLQAAHAHGAAHAAAAAGAAGAAAAVAHGAAGQHHQHGTSGGAGTHHGAAAHHQHNWHQHTANTANATGTGTTAGITNANGTVAPSSTMELHHHPQTTLAAAGGAGADHGCTSTGAGTGVTSTSGTTSTGSFTATSSATTNSNATGSSHSGAIVTTVGIMGHTTTTGAAAPAHVSSVSKSGAQADTTVFKAANNTGTTLGSVTHTTTSSAATMNNASPITTTVDLAALNNSSELSNNNQHFHAHADQNYQKGNKNIMMSKMKGGADHSSSAAVVSSVAGKAEQYQ
ncbi:unnamed protein product [Amoebophrya sp. A120]|nr:unnamed protein product [Amoebophrya sp. A120]|eukprot:GSA120T00023574001.1